MLRLTIISSEPLIKEHDSLATFLIPPGSKGFNNVHPIRVYQQDDSTQAASPGYYLILVSMLRNLKDEDKYAPLRHFLSQFYPENKKSEDNNEESK